MVSQEATSLCLVLYIQYSAISQCVGSQTLTILMSTRSNMDASERRTKLRLTGECEGLQCGGPVFKREAIVQIHVV